MVGTLGKVFPDALFVLAFQSLAQVLPGAGSGEKGLAHVEAEAVVVRIEKPGWNIVP